ncbi:CRISPR-associated protein [Corynebacterium renale]|uniref:CRISPR system Cascade subunit CasC n=1 Tax=Corynebacterium renale TaxID=1724 RepID=A0A2A9DNP4_9CORY|nr:type I-E CRISPR-associated protein Cas7/Cse4/CasC [Corynebacterium renale]PFG27592.1 CRISPR system Cascade subunit CasC [Corynebacterium renale]SQG63719.1 CRISPR-associated protein [Corynebacterium renale]SQI23004.1 CRISPR-associated protein [Corynebacterium renale]STD01766.1 CRISPR-associated protein [Corynebacterium renale]
MSLVIDIHALQTLPPSLINRDDTGAPKSAVFGGVSRQRVSSQSWKRAIRKDFNDRFSPELVGSRSKRLPEQIARLLEKRGDVAQADAIGRVEQLFKAAGIKTVVEKPSKKDAEDTEHNPYPQTSYLIFLSPAQVERAVTTLIEKEGEKLKKSEAQEILDTDHSADMAMFGRMVADDAAYNVDAAVQVAHAIGVHASAPEFDFFTAVDDLAEAGEETGAGMLGTVQMMSSTLYRYATVNVEGLEKNLGSQQAANETLKYFVDSFVASMPTGKINTFANQTLPELVYITVRDSRPVSLVNAFEDPVEADNDRDRRTVAADRLATEAKEVQEKYGFVPKAAYVIGLGNLADSFKEIAQEVTLPELGEKLVAEVEKLQQGAE